MKVFTKAISTLALVILTTTAFAGEMLPYSKDKFNKLLSEEKPVVVAIKADWCANCKAQKPIVSKLMQSPDYQNVSLFIVDFDAEKPVVSQFKATMQSTLIAFKNGKEVGRSVGDTTYAGIESLIKKTL